MSILGPLPQYFHAFYEFLPCKQMRKNIREIKVKYLTSAGRKVITSTITSAMNFTSIYQ